MKLLKSLLCLGLIANSIPAFASQPAEPAGGVKTSTALFGIGAGIFGMSMLTYGLFINPHLVKKTAEKYGPNYNRVFFQEQLKRRREIVKEEEQKNPRFAQSRTMFVLGFWGSMATGLAGFGLWLAGK